jgi:transposase
MRRHELTDDHWDRLEPLLPPERPAAGRLNKDHRTVLNGIHWILRTGAPWRDLPERYGNWTTIDSQLRRCQPAGVWERILTEIQTKAAHEDQIDGLITMIDSTSSRAYQHVAGARKGDPDDHGLGRSRGGLRSKLHLTTERGGKPNAATLTAGQRHESTQAIVLLVETLARRWSDAVAGDKAYSTINIRNWLTGHEIAAVIPYKDNETGPKDDDREAYRERPIIGRTIDRLKRYRRIATRYEKLAATYLAMVTIACILE